MGLAVEWRLSGKQFVHSRAETIDVRSSIQPVGLAPGLFGRHIRGRSHYHPRNCQPLIGFEIASKTEVHNTRMLASALAALNHYICGLYVPMHDSHTMGAM